MKYTFTRSKIFIIVLLLIIPCFLFAQDDSFNKDIKVNIPELQNTNFIEAITSIVAGMFSLIPRMITMARTLINMFVVLIVAAGGIGLIWGSLELNDFIKKRIFRIFLALFFINAYYMIYMTVFNFYISISGSMLNKAEGLIKTAIVNNYAKTEKQLETNIRVLQKLLDESNNSEKELKKKLKELKLSNWFEQTFSGKDVDEYKEKVKSYIQLYQLSLDKIKKYKTTFSLYIQTDPQITLDGKKYVMRLKGKLADPNAIVVGISETYKQLFELDTKFDIFKGILKAVIFLVGLISAVIIVVTYYIAILEMGLHGFIGPLLIVGMVSEKFSYLAERYFGGLITHTLKILTISAIYILIIQLVFTMSSGIIEDSMSAYTYMLVNGLFVLTITLKLPSVAAGLASGNPSLDLSSVTSSVAQAARVSNTTVQAANRTAQTAYNAGHSTGGALAGAAGAATGAYQSGGGVFGALGAATKSLATSAKDTMMSGSTKWRHEAMGIGGKGGGGIQDKGDLDFQGGGSDTSTMDASSAAQRMNHDQQGLSHAGVSQTNSHNLNPYSRLSQRAYNPGANYWRKRFKQGVEDYSYPREPEDNTPQQKPHIPSEDVNNKLGMHNK